MGNDDATYTHLYFNGEWGDEARINDEWELVQEMDEAEAEEYIEEWLRGEEPDKWSQFPQSVEVEVHHDAGQPYHHVVAYERRDYPEGHDYHGDSFDEGYPIYPSRHDTESEALEAAYELMEEYNG